MRKPLSVLALLIAVTTPWTNANAQDMDYGAFVQRSIKGYVRPAFKHFAKTTETLPQAITALCAQPSDTTRSDFAKSYRKVITAFAGISFLRFGPLIDDNRLESLAFMPDPRGIGQRQLNKALSAKDDGLTNASDLANKSVALQGLTALQLIAFDKNGRVSLGADGERKQFLCDYATAISQNVGSIAAAIDAEWNDPDGFTKVLLSPTTESPNIRSQKEALETIFNSVVTGYIIVKDQELLPALGKSLKKSKPNRLPFSRSLNSVAYIKAELLGLEQAIASANYGPALSEEYSWIPGSLAFEFHNAEENLDAVNSPVRQTLRQEETYNRFKLLTITINSLRDTTALELAGALGLSGGFNALDGD